jgi:DNA-binding MarR family transcriptional regulator
MNSQTDPLSLQTYIALLLLQRKMRRTRALFNHPLGTVESLAISLMAAKSPLNPSELSQYLNMAKSKVTQLIVSLQNHKYISAAASPSDRRKVDLYFTESGQKLISELDLLATKVARLGLVPLDAQQRKHVSNYMDKLATGLGAAPDPVKQDLYHFISPQRRMIRISGMISRRYFKTPLDICDHHILYELTQSKELDFQYFCRKLPFHPSKISRAISRLAKKQWVIKKIPKNDRRGMITRLTQLGIEKVAEMHSFCAQQIEEALKGLPKVEIEKFNKFMLKAGTYNSAKTGTPNPIDELSFFKNLTKAIGLALMNSTTHLIHRRNIPKSVSLEEIKPLITAGILKIK